MTKRTYRVIQWATGGVGRAAIEGVLGHPDLELVGCWVHSDAKSGKDVGELIGRDPIGGTASNDVDRAVMSDRQHPGADAGATLGIARGVSPDSDEGLLDCVLGQPRVVRYAHRKSVHRCLIAVV